MACFLLRQSVGAATLLLLVLHVARAGAPALALIDSPQKAHAAQSAWAGKLGKPVEWTNSAGIKFRLIPPGRFMMGSSDGDADAPQREVTISKPFYVGMHEVTRKQWEAVTGKKRSTFFPGDNQPINFITVYDARHFVGLLNKKEKGAGYRLPTEAEWEYAARAGEGANFPGGNAEPDLAKVGWYYGNSEDTTHPVGQKAANGFGLHDMHGNVWEWCSDYYAPDYYRYGAAVDPTGPKGSLYGYCVLRGGSIYMDAKACRASNRAFYQASRTEKYIGFRIVLPVQTDAGKTPKK